MVKPRETAELIDNRRKCLEKESAKKETTFFVERNKSRLNPECGSVPGANVFLVVKLLRAHEGCLGTIRR